MNIDASAHDDTASDAATRTTASSVSEAPAPEKPEKLPPYKVKAVVEPQPATRSIWTRIERPFVFGFLLTLGGLAALLLGLALTNLSTVLIYIALALFAALGLDPAVRMLVRRGMSRTLSIVTVVVALFVLLSLILWAVVPTVVEQVSLFVDGIPESIRLFRGTELYVLIEEQFGDGIAGLVEDVQQFLTDPNNIAAIGGGALQIGASIATGISGVIIVLVLTLYFVATLPSMKRALLRFAPARDRDNAATITDQITDSVGGYVMGMVVLAFGNAVFVLLLYVVLGLPFPLLMATIAFMITLIPLVGSVIFWVIGTGLAVLTSPVSALIFGIAYLVYMQIEAYLFTPKVMNRAIAIPGALVVIGALVGGTLLGLLGALVAVPVTASILIIINQVFLPRQDARV